MSCQPWATHGQEISWSLARIVHSEKTQICFSGSHDMSAENGSQCTPNLSHTLILWRQVRNKFRSSQQHAWGINKENITTGPGLSLIPGDTPYRTTTSRKLQHSAAALLKPYGRELDARIKLIPRSTHHGYESKATPVKRITEVYFPREPVSP